MFESKLEVFQHNLKISQYTKKLQYENPDSVKLWQQNVTK